MFWSRSPAPQTAKRRLRQSVDPQRPKIWQLFEKLSYPNTGKNRMIKNIRKRRKKTRWYENSFFEIGQYTDQYIWLEFTIYPFLSGDNRGGKKLFKNGRLELVWPRSQSERGWTSHINIWSKISFCRLAIFTGLYEKLLPSTVRWIYGLRAFLTRSWYGFSKVRLWQTCTPNKLSV